VVLVVLVLVWAVVLGPSLLRRAVDRQSKDSIGSFHRQLHVLGQTGPSTVAPAHRLGGTTPVGTDQSGRWLVSVSSRPSVAAESPEALAGSSPPERRTDPYFRPGACKRRRDVLMILVCTLTITGLIGSIPAAHMLLAITGLVAVLLIGYVGLLVRLRNQALEREVKLRYLPRGEDFERPLVVRRAAASR